MRKGFGCGAVGDRTVDLARSVGVGGHGGHYILPQRLTLPVDSLKVTVVTPHVRGGSS